MDLWDFFQQRQIRQARREAGEASRAGERAQRSSIAVEERLDRLTLACRALWELFRARTGLTENDLLEKMEQLDLLDGKRDGRLSVEEKRCPDCRRKNHPRREVCLYCSAELPPGSAFDGAGR